MYKMAGSARNVVVARRTRGKEERGMRKGVESMSLSSLSFINKSYLPVIRMCKGTRSKGKCE